MIPDRKTTPCEPVRFDDVRDILEMIPCPAALWSRDRSSYLLNGFASHLFRFSENDLVNHPSLWIECIHPADRQKFVQYQKEFALSVSSASCDYRFFPKGATQPIWIRDISGLAKQEDAVPWDVFSTFTEVSDLKGAVSTDNKGAKGTIIADLIHDLTNRLHTVSMGLELANTGVNGRAEISRLLIEMQSMRDSLQNLRDCIQPAKRSPGCQDPAGHSRHGIARPA
jgi:hypothetical protein